jgi:hypothetical protein
MSVQIKDITYRHIALMLASALPIESDDFSMQVESNLEAIKRLPQTAKVALRSAYIFSRKVPRQERQDLFQDIALAVLKSQTGDEKLAYAIARCDWRDWWKKYRIRQHYSLDSVTEDEDGNPVTLGELIIGEAEWERKMDGKLDAHRIWESLPDNIKPIVIHRLLGQALTHQERNTLNYWVKTKGYQLLLQS